VMVIYAAFLDPVIPNALGNILIASVISTPAGLAIAALMVPFGKAEDDEAEIVIHDPPVSVMDALVKGTMDGVPVLVSIVASLIVAVALVRFQSSVVRQTGSIAVSADALHYRGDLLLNGGVLLALVVGPWLGWNWLDPALALVIGGFVLYGAWRIVVNSLDVLMDREVSDQDRARIRALCEAQPEVIGVHEMRTRSAGQNIFVQLHLELDGGMRLREANAIAHRVEHEIQAAFPGAEVLIHQDPTSEPPHVAARNKTTAEAKAG